MQSGVALETYANNSWAVSGWVWVQEKWVAGVKNSYVLVFSLQGSGEDVWQKLRQNLSRTFLSKSKIWSKITVSSEVLFRGKTTTP